MPPAPTPRYTRSGTRVGGWRVTVEYDEGRDTITVTRTRLSADGRHDESHHQTYPHTDVEGTVNHVASVIRVQGARRLF